MMRTFSENNFHFLSDFGERCRAAEEDRVHSREYEHALQRGNRG